MRLWTPYSTTKTASLSKSHYAMKTTQGYVSTWQRYQNHNRRCYICASLWDYVRKKLPRCLTKVTTQFVHCSHEPSMSCARSTIRKREENKIMGKHQDQPFTLDTVD